MRKIIASVIAVLALFAPNAFAQGRKTLDIYVIDVEGGNAVLFCHAFRRVRTDRCGKWPRGAPRCAMPTGLWPP